MKRFKGQAEPIFLIIALIIIIAIAGLGFYYLNGYRFPTLAVGINPNSGVQILGLSNVQIIGINQQNFSRSYLFATLLIGGAFQPVTSSSTNIASQIGNSSWIGNGQTDSISIQTLFNQIIYQANGNAGSSTLNTYSASVYSGQFSYTDCNGNTQIVSGNQNTNGWGCLSVIGQNPGNPRAIDSYANSCETAVRAQGNGAYGVAVSQGISTGFSAQCWQITRQPWGNIYQLSQGIPNSTIQVTMNGQSFKLGNQNTQAQIKNGTGKVIAGGYWLPVQSGGTFFGPPSPTSIGILFINQSQRRVLQYSSLGLILAAQTSLNQSLSATSSQNYIAGTTPPPYCVGNTGTGIGVYGNTKCLIPSIAQLNNIVANNNSKLQNTGFYQPSGSYPIAIFNNGTTNYNLILNDTSFAYIRPQIQIFSSATSFGFILAKANCQIQPITPVSFKSGSSTIISVNVKNSGQSAGGCIVSAKQYNTQALTITRLGITGGIIQPGQTNTTQFQVSANQNINATAGAIFQTCDAATQTQCTNASATITVGSQCNTGYIFQNGQCVPISVITVPTTTVCSGSQCTTSTTTINPTVCQPPSVFNQTLFNQNVKPPCWIPPSTGTPLWQIIVAIIIILAIIGIAFMLGSNRG